MTTRERPITVRPRKGSELEAAWLECQRSTAAMREIIHQWADQNARKEENK